MAYQKINNRYYDLVDGRVLKATKDEEDNYHICGDMSSADFNLGLMTDQNSIDEFANIKSALGI